MSESYMIKRWAVGTAILLAIMIEYYLIVVETFQNFQTAYGTIGGLVIYLLVTIISLIFLKVAFKRIQGGRFMLTYGMAFIIVVMIGIIISMVQGYTTMPTPI